MIKRLMTCALIAMFAASPLIAQQTAAKVNPLLKDAKVTEAAARQSALAKVPGGKIRESELEKENGKLVWSFDIKVEGKSGIEEVQVDALSGDIVSVEHETPKDEAKEALAEKAKAKGKKKP